MRGPTGLFHSLSLLFPRHGCRYVLLTPLQCPASPSVPLWLVTSIWALRGRAKVPVGSMCRPWAFQGQCPKMPVVRGRDMRSMWSQPSAQLCVLFLSCSVGQHHWAQLSGEFLETSLLCLQQVAPLEKPEGNAVPCGGTHFWRLVNCESPRSHECAVLTPGHRDVSSWFSGCSDTMSRRGAGRCF